MPVRKILSKITETVHLDKLFQIRLMRRGHNMILVVKPCKDKIYFYVVQFYDM